MPQLEAGVLSGVSCTQIKSPLAKDWELVLVLDQSAGVESSQAFTHTG